MGRRRQVSGARRGLVALVAAASLAAAGCSGADGTSRPATAGAEVTSAAAVCPHLRQGVVAGGGHDAPWARLARLRLQLDSGVEPAIQILRATAPGSASSPAGPRALHLLRRWRGEARGVLRAVAQGGRPAPALAAGAPRLERLAQRIEAELAGLEGPSCAGAMTSAPQGPAPLGRDAALAYAVARVRLPEGTDASVQRAAAPALRRAVVIFGDRLRALGRRSVARAAERHRETLVSEGRLLAAALERAADAAEAGRPPSEAVLEPIRVFAQPFVQRALGSRGVAFVRARGTGGPAGPRARQTGGSETPGSQRP